MSCIGCGLIDEITEQRIAVSSTWGGPGLGGFGDYDRAGAPIYCDDIGELRTLPPMTDDWDMGSYEDTTPAAFTGARQDKLAGTTIFLNNPSSSRYAWGFLAYAIKWGFTMSTTGGSIVLGSDLNVDVGAGFVTINTLARTWGIPFTSAYSHEEIELDVQMILIPPAGVAEVEFVPYIDSTLWIPGTGSYDSARVGYGFLIRPI